MVTFLARKVTDKSKFEKGNKMIKDTITLKFGDWQAVICPRLGGNIIALKYDEGDVLRPLVNEADLKINPYL